MKQREKKQLRLMGKVKEFDVDRPVQKGFDYKDWPVIKPANEGNDFHIKMVHWEYVPSFIQDEIELQNARKSFTWLNARSENLFLNEKGKRSMFAEGATSGRCLVLSTGFFEWRHIPVIGKKGQQLKATDRIPYYITLKDRPDYFFMAGVSRIWTNHSRNQSADTFAIVMTDANELLEKIHNTKKRMPTILPQHLAERWIQDGLSEAEIKEIAHYQMPASEMIAWPVAKNFLNKANPEEEFHYENLPPLFEKDEPGPLTLF